MTGRAMAGPAAPDAAPEPTIVILGWRPLTKNNLRGFVTVKLRNGLILHDLTVQVMGDRQWVGMPGKPRVARDGSPILDPTTGKAKYQPIAAWPDRATADRFSEAVLAALEAAHPGAAS